MRNIIDFADRLVVLLLAIRFFVRFSTASLVHPQYVLMLIEAGLVTTLVVIRPWGQSIATKPWPVLVSFLATLFLMLFDPEGYRPDNATLGGVLMLFGVLMSVTGKLALNRRFGIVPANRGIQDKGPFALVRHPIYAGYFITYTGFFFTNPTLWNASVYSLALMFQVLRIMEEEKILGLDPAYVAYRQKVRYRLLPGVF